MWRTIFFIVISMFMLAGCGLQNQHENEENISADSSHQSVSSSELVLPFVKYEQLAIKDGQLVDERGKAFQLRGVSTHGIGWFPQYVNANAFRSVKEAGGNVIRIAAYTEGDNCYLENPLYNTTLVCQAIENAKALGMYVIVDWHILTDGNPNTHLNEAITFFDAIASRYAEDPAILYEVCNEPNGTDWASIQQYAYAIFPVIRQYSPKAVILLGVPEYSSDLQCAIDNPFPEKNFAYTFHFYAGEHWDYSVLMRAKENQVPVIVSEWGVGTYSSGKVALDSGEDFVSFLNKEGISWVAWSLCNKDEVYSMLKPDCEKLGGFNTSDLTDYGKLIFHALKGADK